MNTLIKKNIRSKLLASLIVLFFISCDPCLNNNYSVDAFFEKEDTNMYIKWFRKWNSNKLDSTYLKQDNKQFAFKKSGGGYCNFPSKEELMKEFQEYAGSGIDADSIGIYSKKEGILAMFYSPRTEYLYSKKSSTNYTNPFKSDSWEIHLFDDVIAKGKWGSTVGYMTYKIKKLE